MLDRAVSHCLHACCFAMLRRRRAKWIMEPAKATATEMHWARKSGIAGQSENSEDHGEIWVCMLNRVFTRFHREISAHGSSWQMFIDCHGSCLDLYTSLQEPRRIGGTYHMYVYIYICDLLFRSIYVSEYTHLFMACHGNYCSMDCMILCRTRSQSFSLQLPGPSLRHVWLFVCLDLQLFLWCFHVVFLFSSFFSQATSEQRIVDVSIWSIPNMCVSRATPRNRSR